MSELPCEGLTNVFINSGTSRKEFRRLARTYCKNCPAIDKCRKLSYTNTSIAGLWAGITEKQRRLIRHEALKLNVEPHTISCVCEIGLLNQCYLHDYRNTSSSRSK